MIHQKKTQEPAFMWQAHRSQYLRANPFHCYIPLSLGATRSLLVEKFKYNLRWCWFIASPPVLELFSRQGLFFFCCCCRCSLLSSLGQQRGERESRKGRGRGDMGAGEGRQTTSTKAKERERSRSPLSFGCSLVCVEQHCTTSLPPSLLPVPVTASCESFCEQKQTLKQRKHNIHCSIRKVN